MPTILITGATDGLGRHVARDLAGEAWTVLAHGRSPEKAERVVAETGGRGYVADLAALADVRRLAGEVLDNEPRIDVLCAQILFTYALAERLGDDGVTVTALHPATFMGTNMVRQSGIAPHSEVAEGARATERLIADPELAGVTGRCFNGLREADPDPQAHDPEARDRLWRLSESLIS